MFSSFVKIKWDNGPFVAEPDRVRDTRNEVSPDAAVLTNYPERLDANDVFCGFLFFKKKRKINFLSFLIPWRRHRRRCCWKPTESGLLRGTGTFGLFFVCYFPNFCFSRYFFSSLMEATGNRYKSSSIFWVFSRQRSVQSRRRRFASFPSGAVRQLGKKRWIYLFLLATCTSSLKNTPRRAPLTTAVNLLSRIFLIIFSLARQPSRSK